MHTKEMQFSHYFFYDILNRNVRLFNVSKCVNIFIDQNYKSFLLIFGLFVFRIYQLSEI